MKKLAMRAAATALALIPAVALAQDKLPAPIDEPDDFIELVGRWVFTVFLAIAVVLLIYAGFLYLTSAGSISKLVTAKSMLIYAVVAIILALLAFGAITAITDILVN